VILKSGNFTDWGKITLGYVVFSEWLIGQFIPVFFMRDSYFATIRDGYGDYYTDTMMAITPTWAFFVMIGVIALGAVAGAYLGKAILKKHFKRAGIA